VVAAALVLRALDFGFVAEPRALVFDFEEWFWPRVGGTGPVVIVDIDEKSLARYGQWPWPRALVAQLVRRIAEGHPRVLGIDIVFAERDRLSPPEIAREVPGLPPSLAEALAQLPASERDLAEAMRMVPTVVALSAGREDAVPLEGPMHPAPIRQAGDDPNPFLKDYKSLLRVLPDLAASAQGAGAIAVEPDDDGVVRRIALAVRHGGMVVPSFAVEVLRVGGAARSIVIDSGVRGVSGITIGAVKIPTDSQARAIPHFAPQLARHYSALDILDPAFDLTQLQSQIVLLGVTGLAIGDLRETPLGLVQGVDIHAQLIESVLFETLLRRPFYFDWIELALALAVGLAAIWLLRYDQPARAAGFALATVAALIGFELASFRLAGLLFDGTYPAATLLATFGVMLVGNLRATRAELGREREAKQRQDGEMAAAQEIQMGLLRHRFPDRPDIDICAHIEPARDVAGDLYDYRLIDRDHRLFFLIADVSGKGPPAAMFMAETKAIVREAVAKFGISLDLMVAEANRKTAIMSADFQSKGGVFVTAFAGILDLRTGDVTYASAGHDAPFVLGRDRGLRRLETEGGPPLGAVDEFPYPVNHDRIEPGEVLLLFTDGVSEAENTGHTLYGSERLAKALGKVPALDARSVVAAVIDDLRRFVGKAGQADDITLLAVRWVADAG
jgi:serine phosphatase RsbU (regulator of sigma subunit)/CHASE2 domain-containing sensor protein